MTGSERLLWMTDTFGDHNGVSTVLRAVHEEIKARNLPVDLMVCSHTIQSDDHLIVVKPLSEFTLPLYRQQPVRIPGYLSVQRAFRRGRYSRIIVSTEGPMGLAALWLKKVFPVKVSFFLHTDWIMFAKEVLSLEKRTMALLERALRIYYRRYDSVFVLNTEQQQWLTGKKMGFDPSRVFLTAHWADTAFNRTDVAPEAPFPFDPSRPVVLYAGRISKEKGVLELPAILKMVQSVFPEIQLVIAGTGPAQEELKQAMPGAYYLGWVSRELLPALYRSSDLLLLPSRFDTFSCVVLEALSCGLPVVAYNSKGPGDILSGMAAHCLAESATEMAGRIVGFFLDPQLQVYLKEASIRRADKYQAAAIMDQLLRDAGLLLETQHV
jgi:glycosyltransferase involved in cell wall biosynthesis